MVTRKQGDNQRRSNWWVADAAHRIISYARSSDHEVHGFGHKHLMMMSARLLNSLPGDKHFQIPYSEVRVRYAAASLLHGVRT